MKHTIGILGAGKVARALAPGFTRAGHRVVGFHSPGGVSARRLARRIPGARGFAAAVDLAACCDVLLLAVPDEQVAVAALALARAPIDWRGKTVLHHAGALGPAALGALRRRGAATGVLHPLQVLADATAFAHVAAETRVRIEGQPAAERVARRLARDLGMRPLKLAPLTRRGRAAYHAAASLVANDAVALLGEGARLLSTLGLDRREAVRALAALLRGAVEHAAGGDLGRALTGPVARGDAGTVAAHLDVLDRHSPAAGRAHRALGEVLISLLEKPGGGLSPAERRRLLRVLRSPGPSGRRAV